MKAAILVAWLVTASSASASVDHPLMSKFNYSGFTAPEWIRNETCHIYANRVVIQRQFGAPGFDVTEERPITIGSTFQQTLNMAAQEELTSIPNGMCDAPSTLVVIYPNADADSK